MRVPLFVLATTVLPSCTIHATTHLVSANRAITEAQQAGGEEYAPYEYTLAERYLEKAWEEAGSADYKISVELSKTSREWAGKALKRMESAGRDQELQNLQEEVREADQTVPEAGREPDPPKDLLQEDDFDFEEEEL